MPGLRPPLDAFPPVTLTHATLTTNATSKPAYEEEDEWELLSDGSDEVLPPIASTTIATQAERVLPLPPVQIATRYRSSISFYVNHVLQQPTLESLAIDTTLAHFLRERLGLTGTKIGCGEGGCGACTVLLSYLDVVTGDVVSVPVNSCLRPVLACNGMSITTIEGIGSSVTGYHPVQERYVWLVCVLCTIP